MKNSGNRNSKNILSSWLLEGEKSSSGDPSLESKKNASTWLGVQPLPLEERPQISISQPIPREEKTSITTKIATIPDFNQTIIQMFGGQPIRVVPPIQNQRNGQSMLDFLGRGFAIQGPANHSQPLTSSHQKPSVNQGSLLDFIINPCASPSPINDGARARAVKNTNIIYC